MKQIAFILVSVMIAQSCTVYSKVPVSLEDAYQEARNGNNKIKAVTNEGNKVLMKDIIIEDGVYYGISIKTGAKVPLHDSIAAFFPIDRLKSGQATTFLVVGILGSLVVLSVIGIVMANKQVYDSIFP